MSQAIYDTFSKNVTNIDFSEVVIQKMARKHPHMEWKVMDVLNMSDFPNDTFDIVVDKGAQDAVLAEKMDSFSPPPRIVDRALRMNLEVCRILKPGGKYLQISFGQPHFRKVFFSNGQLDWAQVATHTVGDGFPYFLYILEKNS
mgnify:CR=1 FL=1|jgi:EEF1A lysine methyltransferase 4